MKKLKNNIEDKIFLQNLLFEKKVVKAKFSLGCFTRGDLAEMFEIIDHFGYVTEINMSNGYCEWKDENDRKMFDVSINVITLI